MSAEDFIKEMKKGKEPQQAVAFLVEAGVYEAYKRAGEKARSANIAQGEVLMAVLQVAHAAAIAQVVQGKPSIKTALTLAALSEFNRTQFDSIAKLAMEGDLDA